MLIFYDYFNISSSVYIVIYLQFFIIFHVSESEEALLHLHFYKSNYLSN